MAGLMGMGGGSGIAAVDFDNANQDEPEPNVSEAEQAQYEEFVRNGFKLLYGTNEGEGPVRKEVIGRLSTGQDRQEALAQTAVWLTMTVEKSAETAGRQLDDAIVLHGGQALFEELVQISEAAKIHDYNEEEMQGAWYKALDMYREANSKTEENPTGRVDPEQLRSQFQELDDADRMGRASEIIGVDPSQAAERLRAMAEADKPADEEAPSMDNMKPGAMA